MRLSRKLILSFSLASALIAIASFTGHQLLLNTENKVDHIIEEISPAIDALQDIRYFSQATTANASELLIHAGKGHSQPDHDHPEHFQATKERLLKNVIYLKLATTRYSDIVRKYFSDEAEDTLEVTALTQTFEKLSQKITALETTQASNAEVNALHDEIVELNNKMIATIGKSLEKEKSELEEQHIEIEKLLEISLQKSIFAAVISLLTIILLWIFVTKKISRPLSKLRRATIAVSKGELDKKLDITSNDEIGDLARSFNEMTERLGETTVSKDYVENILRSMAEALFVLDIDGRITRTNRTTMQLLGYQKEELNNTPIGNVIPELNQEKNKELSQNVTDYAYMNEREAHLKSKSGKKLTVYLTCSPLNDADDNLQGMILLAHDISARKEAEERLHYLANFDPLTGLSNRAMLFERLAEAISQPLSERKNVGLLLCGLDRFKLINDTLGHEVGDQLLKKMAQRLQASLRSCDTAARIGGDEFAVVLPDISDTRTIISLAEKIVDNLAGPLQLSEQEVFVTLSVGISLYPFDGVDPLTLLKNADIALCNAKDKGKNQMIFYADVSGAKSTEHLKLESDLQHALERNEIAVYYQPQINIEQRRITGCEALIRWQHPERGMVSPAEFLPAAEETGLIVALGEHVLRTACAQAKQWVNAGHDDFTIAINLSDQEFKRDDLLGLIDDTLTSTQLRARNLELEITENIVMHNPRSAESIMQKIRAMGVELSIDDFGTGYSSLSHLKRFPINTVKIDRSFIMDIVSDKDDLAIVEAILAIARKMSLNVIAEGVENSEQQELLRENGCFNIQGFLYSPALPADKFTALLADQATLFSRQD